jgi:hydrogenase maturation protein HypF
VIRAGRRIEIRGIVQGVGFRPWIYRLASEEGVAGRVRNDGAGVTIEAFASEQALDVFIRRLEQSPPSAAEIRALRAYAIPSESVSEFSIAASSDAIGRHVSIPPDLATCDACLREVFDRADRRHRYAFTCCTDCGPRFTIAADVPYDRARTTMAPFEMCEACRREYESPADRRFHAEANACPVCGPLVSLRTPERDRVDCDDPIAVAAGALADGLIVAVKGIGGFHLACDATSAEAVARLRARKRRDEKPLAVMVRDLDEAHTLAELTAEAQRLLASPERPIVLVPRRDRCILASEVAPSTSLVGLMLPYTALHHLLVRDAGRPLLMTSGNLSDEPLAYRNDDAFARLHGIADLFLVHDRDIVAPCDDSVVRVIAGAPAVLRRSRGWVPRGIALATPVPHPVLACGALLKNTFCLAAGESAYLGPHIGDLDILDTYEFFERSVDRLQRFLGITPQVIAHDRHPSYMSTRYAGRHPAPLKIAVQHHHAHVASAMAEHGLPGPVIGVAYDGTGHGDDGTSWGGEVLIARDDGFERAATFRPIPLAGGDAAIREPWRIALALVDDAFDGKGPIDTLALFVTGMLPEMAAVRHMIASRFRSPLARGVGRYFDGIGSLVLGRSRASFEGQIAAEWNLIADPHETKSYAFDVDVASGVFTIDLRAMVRAIVTDLTHNTAAATISAKFHNTLVAATAAMVHHAAHLHGRLPVVLTGGCFQNARLAEAVGAALGDRYAVHLHRRVPSGDGGIALGQAVVAGALARGWGE